MIVPLFSGSGMRVKIVEGMLMGKIVITTSLGKEGIAGEHKKDLLVANTTSEFIEAIEMIIHQPHFRQQIGAQAKATASNLFDGQKAARQIIDIYQGLLTYKSAHQAAETTTTLPV